MSPYGHNRKLIRQLGIILVAAQSLTALVVIHNPRIGADRVHSHSLQKFVCQLSHFSWKLLNIVLIIFLQKEKFSVCPSKHLLHVTITGRFTRVVQLYW